jgi:stage II sporulation protein AA (anti-sigma F factor antagonist)
MQTVRTDSWSLAGPEVMEIEGRLDSGTAAYVEEDVLLCIRSGARKMVIDCGSLTYMSAAGLRTIMKLAQNMKLADGDFAVCGLQPQVHEMFVACGIDALIPIFGDQREAVAAFVG